MKEFKKFVQLVEAARESSVLEDFLMGITTPAERQKMMQRVEIVERLLKDEPQHQIAENLHVGVATVTRGSRELALGRFQILRNKK